MKNVEAEGQWPQAWSVRSERGQLVRDQGLEQLGQVRKWG